MTSRLPRWTVPSKCEPKEIPLSQVIFVKGLIIAMRKVTSIPLDVFQPLRRHLLRRAEHRGGANPRMLTGREDFAEIGELPPRNLEAQGEDQPSSHPCLSHSGPELH